MLMTKHKTWMPLVPTLNGPNNSHRVSPRNTQIKIFDPTPGRFKPGHMIVRSEDGFAEHMEPGTVPEAMVSKKTIEEANRVAFEERKKVRRATNMSTRP